MRIFATFAVLAFLGCSSSNGSGSGGSSQCTDLATQLCQQAETCTNSADHVLFVYPADPDSGVNSFGFTVNGDITHCESFMKLNCGSNHEAKFIAGCTPPSGAPQCGTDSHLGNGLVLPPACNSSM
jgi:hypothetical protein